MRVCIVATEFLGAGPTGGLGVAARGLAAGLKASGDEVEVLLPFPRTGQALPAEIAGIRLHGYRRTDLRRLSAMVRQADAEIYHYVQASIGAYIGERSMPARAHVVALMDPRDRADWIREFRHPTRSAVKLLPVLLYFGSPPASIAARRADAVQVPAEYLREKGGRVYGLSRELFHCPMPFPLPPEPVKSETPLVISVGRLDRRKRPDLLLDLAERFPQVQFVLIGGGQDAAYTAALHRRGERLANLSFTGFIDQTRDPRFTALLGSAWILVNSSEREGLPLTFTEAAAQGCAILSRCDPDGYASRFGYHAADDDLAAGLAWLLEDRRWREGGRRAREHVRRVHDPDRAMAAQLAVHEAALERSRRRQRATQ